MNQNTERTAESSPATVPGSSTPAPATTETPSIESLLKQATPEQKTAWQMKGTLPELNAAQTAASEPAKPGETAAESEPAKETKQEPKPELTPEERSQRDKAYNERRQRRLVRETAQAKAKAELLEKEIAALKTGKPESAPGKTPAAAVDAEPVMPELESFNSTAEYNAAMKKYSKDLVKFELDQRDKVQAAKTAKETPIAAVTTFQKAVDDFKKDHPDFDDAFEAVSEFDDIAPHLSDAIVDSGIGPQLILHLGANSAEIDRLAGLPPRLGVLELGKIVASLQAAPPAPKVKTETTAPPPGKILGGPAATAADPLVAAYKSGDYKTAMRIENERLLNRKLGR